MENQLFSNLDELFSSLDEELKIAIHCHDNPDPDTLSSAIAIKWLLKKIYNIIDIKIFHGGDISHPQNKTLMKVFNIDSNSRDKYDEEICYFNRRLEKSQFL